MKKEPQVQKGLEYLEKKTEEFVVFERKGVVMFSNLS